MLCHGAEELRVDDAYDGLNDRDSALLRAPGTNREGALLRGQNVTTQKPDVFLDVSLFAGDFRLRCPRTFM